MPTKVTELIPARLVTRYVCNICIRSERFESLIGAQRCEARGIEKRKFRKGSRVAGIGPRFCPHSKDPYYFEGVVTRVVGPQLPPDTDYQARVFGKHFLCSHVFQYEVAYVCPVCRNQKSVLLYAPELKKVPGRRKIRK